MAQISRMHTDKLQSKVWSILAVRGVCILMLVSVPIALKNYGFMG